MAPHARALGMAGLWLHDGPLPAKARVFVTARPRYSRPRIVSFSGLDGAGKSTQVATLHDTFTHLGVPTAVQWAGFSNGKRLHAVFSVLDRRRHSHGPRWSFTEETPGRERFMPPRFEASPVRQHLWVLTIATINAAKLWKHLLRPRRGTRVLLFDRFSPDGAVKLDYHYRHIWELKIDWQRALFKFISPKPDVGFLLALPSETAFGRKEDWEPAQFAAMEHAYDEEAHRWGLIRLDGTEPAESLSRRVAIAAWQGIR